MLPKQYKDTIKLIFSKKQLYVLLLPLIVLSSTYFYLNQKLNNENQSDNQKIKIVGHGGRPVKSDVVVNKFEDNTYSYRIQNDQAKLQVNKANNNPEEKEGFIYIAEPATADEKNNIKTSVLFVDDSTLNFESADITLTKPKDENINAILMCDDWDFNKDDGTCSNWQITDIKPTINSDSIAFNVTHFSAYAGAYLEILNVQTNLTVGDIWEVRFNTYGTSDLTIEAIEDTIYGEDVQFIEFYCGDNKLENVYQDNKVFIPNYSCDGQLTRLVDRSVTFGRHVLQFTFGDSVKIAKNFACNVGTLSDTCEVNATQAMTNGEVISGTGNLIIRNAGNLTTSAGQTFSIAMGGDVTIQSGGNITGNISSLTAANLDVQLGGSINANSKGFAGGTAGNGSGTGRGVGCGSSGCYGGGAGYGGTGGAAVSNGGGPSYGSIKTPTDYGSGGGGSNNSGLGGSGGGAVKIAVTGTLNISGNITAIGGTGGAATVAGAGGGSGGSIWLSGASITGSGTVSANGGPGNNSSTGAGGGGRIAVYYTSLAGTVNITAYGGATSARYGGAGSIYKKSAAQTNGDLIIDNNNQSSTTYLSPVGNTKIEETITLDNITVSNYGALLVQAGTNASYTNLDISNEAAVIYNGGTFTLFDGTRDLTIPQTSTFFINTPVTFNNLTVNGSLIHHSNGGTETTYLNVTTTGDMTVGSTGTINLNGRGYTNRTGAAGYGPGAGNGGNSTGNYGSGASHGGTGGASSDYAAGAQYGSVKTPTTIGSSGGGSGNGAVGGAGGGSAKFIVAGTLTVNGAISANGGNGTTAASAGGGGGAGGSIWINAGTLTGSSTISANGGVGAHSTENGGGSGGRIALYYGSMTGTVTVSAYGGSPSTRFGGAGTIFKKSTVQTNGELVIDNNNQSHSTYLSPVGTTKVTETLVLDNITLSNFGSMPVQSTTNITHSAIDLSNEGILVYTGGTFTLFSGGQNLSLGTGSVIFDNVGTTYGTSTIAGTYNASAASTFGSTTISGTYNANAASVFGDTTISGTYNQGAISTFGDTTISGTYNVTSSTAATFGNVTLSGSLTHAANAATELYKANITANGDFTITGAATVSLNGKGFGVQSGTGAGGAGSSGSAGGGGGGHGGTGGTGVGSNNAGTTYGNTQGPVTLGSGGGTNSSSTGGPGGGALKLNVTGTLSMGANITANGSNAGVQSTSRGAGGGAGGSLYITATTLTGTGNFTANGGTGSSSTLAGHGGGGGGGRIEVFSAVSTGYSGSIIVNGGTSSGNAGATGTTYVDLTGPVTSFNTICSTDGNSCTTNGSTADPQEAFSVTSITGSTNEPNTSLSNIQIGIRDTTTNQWLNTSNNLFDQNTEQRINITSVDQTLPYTGSVNWTYNASLVTWSIDHTYEITLFGTNPRVTKSDTFQFVFSNSPPTVSNVTASQASDGDVDITYDVTDNETSSTTIYLGYDVGVTIASDTGTGTGGVAVSDATLLPNSGTIIVDDEMISYTGKVGNTLAGTITRGANNTSTRNHTSGTTIYKITSNITGDTGSVPNGTSKSINWDAKADLNGLDSSTVEIEVISNDGASSSMIGRDLSSAFALDVKDPVFTDSFSVNASLVTPLIYFPCTDESSIEMAASTASNLAGATWIAHSASTNFANAAVTYSAGMTLYGQCRDPFSNTTTIQVAVIPGIPSNIFYQDVSNPLLEDWREFIAWGVIDSTSIPFEAYRIYRSENGGSYSLLTSIEDRLVNHLVDTDLNNSIEYRYKILSEDENGNTSAYSAVITDTPNGSGGTDLSTPTISNVQINDVTTNQATITWTTNKFSNSTVYLEATNTYPGSDKSSYDFSQGAPSVVTEHSVILGDLTPDTDYSFLVESIDAGDNIATSSDNSYQFTTEPGPEITNVSVTQVFDSEAVVTWKTNTPSSSSVVYSKNSDLSEPTFTAGSADLVTNHSVTLTSLDIGSSYYFYVESTDVENNQTQDKNIVSGSAQYYSLSTTIDTDEPVISEVETTLTGETGATITWITNEQATSTVNWGLTTDLGQEAEIAGVYTTSHSISILGLEDNTKYYYQVSSADRSGNIATDNEILDFTTNEITTVEIPGETVEVPATEEQLQNEIENGISDIIAGASKSVLEAILEALAENDNLSDLSDESLSDYLTNITSSTLSGPTIGGSNLTIEPGSTSAVVSWVTDRPANSLVAYVKDADYVEGSENPYVLEVGDSSAAVTEHTVTLEGLEPETTYHIQSRSKGSFGPVSASPDNTFITNSLTADIDNIRISEITESSVTLRWETTIPTRSQIIITDSTTGIANTDDNSNFIKDHSFGTDQLNPSTNYTAQVISIDENGGETESSIVSFSTVLNGSPPKIEDVRVITSLIPGKVEQVQTIISWKTNKPSSSKVLYDEGVRPNSELRLSVPEDTTLRREHIIISSSFAPGKVYSYKVESVDTGGNVGTSQNYTLLTPQPRESVVDLIVKNLEEMFGFLN